MKDISLNLSGVIYRDGPFWVSHCLELDIVGQGETPQAAFEQSVELCCAQIVDAIEQGDLASVFHPAPPDIWAIFARGHAARRMKKPEGIKPGNRIARFEVREPAFA